MRRYAIPAEGEGLIDELLRLDAGASGGWLLVARALRHHHIDAQFRHRDGSWAFVRLVHQSAPLPQPRRQTERFGLAPIKLSAGARDRVKLEALLDGLAAQVRRGEDRWRWVEAGDAQGDLRIDPERLAFSSRVKPALRISAEPEEVAGLRETFEAVGAHVDLLAADDPDAHDRYAVVMVARDPADAARMVELERQQFELDQDRRHAAVIEMGERLGYPSCCVEAFIETRAQEDEGKLDSNWIRARHAWHPRPEPRLNNLVSGEQVLLISFIPCSYRCPAAKAVADAIAEAAAKVDAASVAALDAGLARNVAIDTGGARAVVELDREGRVLRASPLRETKHEEPDPALAERIVGARMGEDGLLDLAGEPALIVPFGSRT